MSAPPYVMGAFSAIIFSRISDRFTWRMPFVVIPFAMVAIGFSVMLGLQGRFEANIGGAYTAVIVACMGIYPWVTHNSFMTFGLILTTPVSCLLSLPGWPAISLPRPAAPSVSP